MTKKRLDLVEFADNPEPRCAVVLLLDTSRSMEGEPVQQLQQGLIELERTLKTDRLASLRIELSVITFGGAVRACDVQGEDNEVPFDASRAFATVERFHAPTLETGGDTPLGEAVIKALNLLNDRKEIYKKNAVDYFRPWIILITDGKPNDLEWEAAAHQIRAEQARKAVLLYAIGVEGADMQALDQFCHENKPLPLKGLAFSELFQWLSKSLLAVAQSKSEGQEPLPPSDGWSVL
ncbi:MAG TPA: VWA domain-containing protein [Bacillota bacterium]|nr:VWA domain-containing protein [Bacillota bacterium]